MKYLPNTRNARSPLNMLILIEGPDGSGKTTLSQNEVFDDFKYIHWGPPETPDTNMFVRHMMGVKHITQPSVIDRLHPSEMIYGEVFRGRVDTDRLGQRMTERYLFSRQTVLVMCLTKYETSRDNWKKRAGDGDEMIRKEQQYKRVYDMYWHFKSELPTVLHDYTRHPPSATRAAVEVARGAPNGGPGIGNFEKGNILVVGEQCNVKGNPPFLLPFIGLSGSSRFVTQAFEDAGIGEKDLYWINAIDCDGHLTSPEFVERLEPRRVIALGNIALSWCRGAGLEPITNAIPHPAYWSRFRAHSPYPVAEAARG